MTDKKKDLTEQAQLLFENHPTVDTFFATADGMFFDGSHRNECASHAAQIGSEVYTFSRNDLEEDQDEEAEKTLEQELIEVMEQLEKMEAREQVLAEQLEQLEKEFKEKEAIILDYEKNTRKCATCLSAEQVAESVKASLLKGIELVSTGEVTNQAVEKVADAVPANTSEKVELDTAAKPDADVLPVETSEKAELETAVKPARAKKNDSSSNETK